MATIHLIPQLYQVVSPFLPGATPDGEDAKKGGQPDVKRFETLFSGRLSGKVPSKWSRWADCAARLKRGDGSQIVDRFKIVRSPLGKTFLLFTVKGAKGDAKTNCHTYTDQKLKSVKEILAGDYVVLGAYSICFVNSQSEILDATTDIITRGLTDEPAKLVKTISEIDVKPGDILVWKNAMGDFIHSTTFDHKDHEGRWIVDDKMGEKKPEKKFLLDLAKELFLREGMDEAEVERVRFSDRSHEYFYTLELRRPKSNVKKQGLRQPIIINGRYYAQTSQKVAN